MSTPAANEIHPLALVSPEATLGEGNRIGPFAVVEEGVVLGNRNQVGAHAVLKTGSRIGSANHIHEHAVIGGVPQDLKFKGGPSLLEIGDRNVLREGVTVHGGSRPDSCTRIGHDNFLMAYCHVAHDCRVGDHVVMANNSALAGEVQCEDRVFVSSAVGVHQFARLGRLAMIGGHSKITRDALPFCITDGNPARVRGLNRVGLNRAGIGESEISLLKKAFRLLLRSGLPLTQALQEIRRIGSPLAAHFADFLGASKRGFHRS